MSARLTQLFILTVVLVSSVLPLTAQTRSRRDSTGSRSGASAPNRAAATAATTSAVPADDPQMPGAPVPGTTTPPIQGYYVMPSPPPPGVPPITPGLPAAYAAPAAAGSVIPPQAGYYVNPQPTSPGSVGAWPIVSDALERAYWELYDHEKAVSLTGKVTRMEWGNPNSYIFLSADGALWAIESSWIQFLQSTVTPAVHVNDNITVKAYLPKELPGGDLPAKRVPWMAAFVKTGHLVRASELTTGFGQKLQMGRPPTDEEMLERLRCSPFGCNERVGE